MNAAERGGMAPATSPLYFRNFSPRTVLLVALLGVFFLFANIILFRLILLLSRSRPLADKRRTKPPRYPTHLLVVLGSGGHTTEMFDMLRRLPLSPNLYHHRTYVISSGDSFSALKAAEFEMNLFSDGVSAGPATYTLVTVTRARKIHQPLFTTPISALLCVWDCLRLLRNQHADQRPSKAVTYPDLILTNGPGTGVCVVVASLILRFFGLSGPPRQAQAERPSGTAEMRTIFIESWARVTTLSLSGKILLPLVDRFLVQWPGLEGKGDKAEYVGSLVA